MGRFHYRRTLSDGGVFRRRITRRERERRDRGRKREEAEHEPVARFDRDDLEDLRYELRSLTFDLESARREAWQDESSLYAAIIVAVLIGTAAVFANDPSFGDGPMWQNVLLFVGMAWVMALPVLIATAVLARVVSAVRRWDAKRKGVALPQRHMYVD